MIKRSIIQPCLAVCVISTGIAASASAGTYRVVASLSNQYQTPGPLVESSPGVFYSTASATEVFSVTKQGELTVLATFPDPPYTVESSPVTAANALVYSSLNEANTAGYVFSVSSTPGSEHTYPAQSLFMAPLWGNLPDGRLFGVAYPPYSLATVDLKGTATSLYQFPPTDSPYPPVYHSDGNYYGLANSSNTSTYFYRVTPSGSFTKIATLPFLLTAFAGTGVLVQATDGNFYGIQPQGLGCNPDNQHGAVFKLTPSGQFSILHDFGPCNMANLLIEGSDGKLYGAARAYNVLFSLTTSGTYQQLFAMNGANGFCPCFLLQGSDGVIYGSSEGGGTTGAGVIFAFDTGLPVPKPKAARFTPQSGAPGTRVLLWGYNLFGASVQFNGVPAAKAVNSGPNYVWATVPNGATTGPITINTPGETSTTRGSFPVN
jgi:hypothetical protein